LLLGSKRRYLAPAPMYQAPTAFSGLASSSAVVGAQASEFTSSVLGAGGAARATAGNATHEALATAPAALEAELFALAEASDTAVASITDSLKGIFA